MRAQATAARRIFQLFVLLAALLAAAYWNWGFLPGRLKQMPIDAIRTATGLDADFKRIVYLPFRGVYIDQPILRDAGGRELFRAKKIRLATDLPAYLQDNRIVIEKIEVDSPATQFRTGSAGSSAEKPKVPGPASGGTEAGAAPVPLQHQVPHPFVVLETIFDDSLLPSNVYLNELDIRHGQIQILPAEGTEPVETLKEIRFRTLLNRRPLIPVQAEFRTSFGRGNFEAEGLVNLSDGRHRLNVKGNVDHLPRWLEPALAARRISVQQLKGDAALDLHYDGESRVEFKLESKQTQMQIQSGERLAAGRFGVQLSGNYAFSTNQWNMVSGILDAKSVTIKNLTSQIDEVQLSSASAAWNPELVEIPRIQGTWAGTSFTIEGGVDRAAEHRTRLVFRQSLDRLDVWKPLAPQAFANGLNLESLRGQIRIEASLSGLPSELLHQIHSVRLQISDGTLKPRLLRSPISQLDGTIQANDFQTFSTEDLSFRYAGEKYSLSGRFDRAEGGLGSVNLTASKWEADARFRYYTDRLECSTFTLESGPSRLGGSGVLTFDGTPSVNANFKSRIIPERLAADWKSKWPWLQQLKLAGVIDGDGTVRGAFQKLENLRVQARARSPKLVYNGLLVFEPVEADLVLESGILKINYARADFYGGEARASGHADLRNTDKIGFETHVFTQNTNLSKFCEKLEFIKNKFSGTMNLDLNLAGYLNDPKSIRGDGNFRISNGEIWQTELFKRLKKVLFLTIEGAENVVFKNASGSFKIAGGGLETTDTTLSSNLIDIHLTGRIGFDSTLALKVVSRFTSGLLQEASEVGGLAPALIHIAENKITRYLITGTFKDPVFTPQK